EDDTVRINFTAWTSEGRMVDSSTVRGQPSSFQLKNTPPGIQEAVGLLTVGEKRRFWIPQKMASRAAAAAKDDAGSIVFEIELVDIVKLDAPPDVKEPPKDAERTASGIASKVLKKGTGTEHPVEDSRVKVQYTGWTTDGKMFDS